MKAVDRFVHRLCLELKMTKGEITQRMGLEELLDWIEYFSEDGERVDEMNPEQIAAAFGAQITHG